jgi:DNA end-binding protein Ku
LLRRALEDTDRVAIVQFALREKTRLGALRIKDDVLVLQSLLWPDEVREANFPALDESVRISAQEREMSAALVESMAADFDPDHFTDDYQIQLRTLIEAKLEKGDSLDTDETFGVEAGEGGKGEVIDLMEALKRSLDRKRGAGSAAAADSDAGEDKDEESEEEADTGTKGAAAKSTTAKAGTAKSTTAKSTTAAKSGTAKSTTAKSTAAKSTKTTADKPAAKATTTRARKGA